MYWRTLKKLMLVIPALFLSITALVPATDASRPEIKNVIFIILDALRADHLGCYGYHRQTSPAIDWLAGRGIVFDRAIVQAGWTKPSMASTMTSTFPSIHKVNERSMMLPENLHTLAEVFHDNGYYTYGFVNNPHLDARLGFDKGFDRYERGNDNRLLEVVSRVLTGSYRGHLWDDPGPIIENIRHFNLLDNGGFEQRNDKWQSRDALLTTDTPHSGRYATHVDREQSRASNFLLPRRKQSLKFGREYIFGAWLKTKNLEDGVVVEIKEGKGEARRVVRTQALTGDNDWTLVWQLFAPWSSSPTDDIEIEIRAGRVNNFSRGEFWVDDVFILPVASLPSFQPAEKLFVYLHLLSPHAPYKPPTAYLNYFREKEGKPLSLVDKYDASIRNVDGKLGVFFAGLESMGVLDETLVIISADHGEAFGEHGMWAHPAPCFYEETVRVPLIFYNPRFFPSPRRVEKVVQASVDLLPSLSDLLGLETPSGAVFQGNSYFQNRDQSEPFAFFYDKDNLTMVTDREWKYKDDGSGQESLLFNIKKDPEEKKNVIVDFPAVAAKLRNVLDKRRLADRDGEVEAKVIEKRRETIPDDMKKQLRALGYVN